MSACAGVPPAAEATCVGHPAVTASDPSRGCWRGLQAHTTRVTASRYTPLTTSGTQSAASCRQSYRESPSCSSVTSSTGGWPNAARSAL